ncbi:hypothetical protein EDC01DRAFT_758875 [Geopyxis carbonaria]|nr:hypothetical protein EDC01DRAFT_758875 [Geopyxis carbonaria]
MVAIPTFSYIGAAHFIYAMANSQNPAQTPRGLGFYNNFIAGNVSLVTGPTYPMLSKDDITKIESGELPDVPMTTLDLISGGDYFYYRPSPAPAFLEQNCHLVVKDEENHITKIDATGIITVSPDVLKIINRSPDAKSLDYGMMDFWQPISIESGSADLSYINSKVIMGQGSLEVQDGKGVAVRMRLFTPSN